MYRDLYDTKEPFYLADLGEIDRLHSQWQSELGGILPHYAVKVNNELKIVEYMASLGTNFDCASIPEMKLVLSLGISPSRIIYAHPIKTPDSLKFAKSHGVLEMTFGQ